ncbi:hypothetical protein [Dactylosporangium darangshiense]|uniref:hypothetical protein n=1 Tax=Dactylosporangium darangshiense TaxID=579108 RepID=UPI003634B137
MTTYGELLDQAIDALDAATVAIGAAPPSGLDDQVHIAVARAQLYRNLHQQVVLVGAAPISLLANELAHATARTGNLADGIVLTAPSSPVAVAVARAAAVAEAATAILASHLAPPAPTILALPPAPAAAALREAGHGRPAALRRIGDVVTAATRLDHRLGVWLAQHTIVAAAISDADRTTTSRLPQAAARTARAKQPSPLDTLQANTALEVPHRQRSIDDFGSAFAALDTARGWLLDHRDHHTAIDLTTLSGVGLSLSHQVSFALRLAGHPLPKDAVAHLTHLWRRAGRLLGQLRDVRNIDTSPEIKTLLQVERWLRGLTRHEHGWRLPEDLVRTDADADTWHSLAIQLAARLPDLATLLDYGSNAAISRNALAQLWWPGPREVHGVWVNHPSGNAPPSPADPARTWSRPPGCCACRASGQPSQRAPGHHQGSKKCSIGSHPGGKGNARPTGTPSKPVAGPRPSPATCGTCADASARPPPLRMTCLSPRRPQRRLPNTRQTSRGLTHLGSTSRTSPPDARTCDGRVSVGPTTQRASRYAGGPQPPRP